MVGAVNQVKHPQAGATNAPQAGAQTPPTGLRPTVDPKHGNLF